MHSTLLKALTLLFSNFYEFCQNGKYISSPDLAMIVKFRFVIAETPEGSVKTSNIVNLHVRTFKGRLLFTTQFDLSFSTTSTSPIKVDDG